MSPSANKTYGIQRVCRAWRLARATVQRHKALADGAPRIPAKRGPKTCLSDDEILAEIRAVLASTLFVGEGHRKVRARLRQERGIRTSMRRVLRIMREHGILACDRTTGVRGPETHDRTITTKTPDEMWAIDATGCLTEEGNAAVFVVIDHCTGECLGVRAARRGTRFEAIECLREAIHSAKGRYEIEVAAGTKLRHDHGSQFISHAFQDELKTLGIESSPSFVRQPEGNGCPVCQDWAIHPHPEGAAALAAPIPHRRGAQPGAPRIRPPLQQPLDHRADWLPNARSAPTHPPRGGRVNTNFNLSQKLDAVHFMGTVARECAAKAGFDTILFSPKPQIMKVFHANMTTVQLKKQLSAGGHDLESLHGMLRAAWAIPNGKGEAVAGELFQELVATAQKQGPAGGRAPAAAPAPSLGRADAERLALLRTTFTAEAEILAKWGITPGLPADARATVVAWWRSRLSRVPDAMGRTIEALDRELAAATREGALRAAEQAS